MTTTTCCEKCDAKGKRGSALHLKCMHPSCPCHSLTQEEAIERQLEYCKACNQMTNHSLHKCLKCPPTQSWEMRFDELMTFESKFEGRQFPVYPGYESIKSFITSLLAKRDTELRTDLLAEIERMMERYCPVTCIPMKLTDDGVHITYKCPDCGQVWGEEERMPLCQKAYDSETREALDSLKAFINKK